MLRFICPTFVGWMCRYPFARVSHFHRMAVLVSMRHRFFDMIRRLLVIQVVDEGTLFFVATMIIGNT